VHAVPVKTYKKIYREVVSNVPLHAKKTTLGIMEVQLHAFSVSALD
jgi:hypothetical protein